MIKNLLKLIVISGLIVTGFFVVSSPTYAVDCARDISGNFAMTSDCTFAGLVDGVDTGTGASNTAILTVQSGLLTVSSNQTVAFGSLSLTGGSIALSGQLNIGMPLWVVDADADGYPSTTTQYAQTSAPTDGRRRNLMTSLTADCDDSTYSADNTCCVDTWVCDTCCEQRLTDNPCGCADNTYSCESYCWYVDCYDPQYKCEYCPVNYDCNCHWECI